MDILFEILFNIIFEPVAELFLKPSFDDLEKSANRQGISKRKRAVLISLMIFIMLMFISDMFSIIFGGILLASGTDGEKDVGLILLLTGVGVLVAYTVLVIVRLNIKARRKKRKSKTSVGDRTNRTALRRIVHVVVDRPLGSTHPDYSDIVYGVNYGFVPDAMGVDGEAQDAYILGVDAPVSELDGVVVAIIHRLDDNEDKWVVAPHGYEPTDAEITEKTAFQEKYFKTELVRN